MVVYVIYGLAATIIFPSVIAVLRYRELNRPKKFIALLLVLGLLAETAMFVLSTQKMNNLFTIHIYALVEILFISLYFYFEIQNINVRNGILAMMTALALFAVLYAVNGNNISEFNSTPRAMECIYFSLLSGWFFYEMSDYRREVSETDYFINGAVLFYFSSCFLIFTFNKYFASNRNIIITMVVAHAVVNAICNLAYAVALWRISPRSYTPS